MREHDADWFAANQLAFHIAEFAKKNISNDKSEMILEDKAAMALAAIYTHFIKWAKGYLKIYYQEYCNPHPSIRMSYIIIYLVEALAANIPIQINKNPMLKKAIQISEKLMIEPNTNIVQKYSIELFNEIKEIETYINKIRNDSESYPYLSRKILIK